MKILLLSLVLLAADGPGTEHFPLDEGTAWTYVATTGAEDEGFSFELTNLAPRELDGEAVTPRRLVAGDYREVSFVAVRDGLLCDVAVQPADVEEPEPRDAPICFLPLAPRLGASWKIESTLSQVAEGEPITLELRVEALDETVEVPAGRFEDCVRVSGHGTAEVTLDDGTRATVRSEKANDYAPGVGLIRAFIREASDDPRIGTAEMVMELRQHQRGREGESP